MAVHAQVALDADTPFPVGRERIRLLEALGREGCISGAAQAVGLTSKAARDAIDAMNNLFGRPLVGIRMGTKRGRGMFLTPQGVRVVAAFRRLESELARTFDALEPELVGSGIAPGALTAGFFSMHTSARNLLRGTVTAAIDGAMNAAVALAISEQTTLTALVTRRSKHELGLFPGREATALIESSSVVPVSAEEARSTLVGTRMTACNRIDGTVARRDDGAANAEITLDIGGGKTLTSIVTKHSASELGLTVGHAAFVLIDASHIILAVD